MLRCGYCELICDSYEGWLLHLVSHQHQANLGVHDIFTKHVREDERNSRSLIISKMNSKMEPFDLLCSFARREPLAFITDAYVHMFPHVSEKFYLLVFDQSKFVTSIQEMHLQVGHLASRVCFEVKSSYDELYWKNKIDSSFFYRRHESIKRTLIGLSWDKQLSKMLQLVSLNTAGYSHREKVMEELESLVHESEEFKDAVLHPFGSCITYLADINADLDVYMDITGQNDNDSLKMTKDAKMEMMTKVYKMFRKKFDFKNVLFITQTRVPIIKLTHPSGLKVDVSFENCLSVRNSKLILILSRFDYRIHPLLMFLRYWARYHNLVGSQSVKNYALILMVLVYLRLQKLIPSVHEIQSVEGLKPNIVNHWNSAFCGSRKITGESYPWLKCIAGTATGDLAQPVMKLAYGFFKEFSELDYETQVICPYLGGYLPRALFEGDGANLPVELESYKVNLAAGHCSAFSTKKLFCVQDPFALNVNVTASCNSQDIFTGWKNACAAAAEALKPYVAVYDSCGTVGILDVVCVHVPVKKEAKAKDAAMNGDKIKSEDDSDRYTRSRRRESRYDRNDRDEPVRIQRVSVYDENEPMPIPMGNLPFVKSEPVSSDEEDEPPAKKTLQSVIVVPESNGEVREAVEDKADSERDKVKDKSKKKKRESKKRKESHSDSSESGTSNSSKKCRTSSPSSRLSTSSLKDLSHPLAEVRVKKERKKKKEHEVLHINGVAEPMDIPSPEDTKTAEKHSQEEVTPTVTFVCSPEKITPEVEQTVRFVLTEEDPPSPPVVPPAVVKIEVEECNNNQMEMEERRFYKEQISYGSSVSYGYYGGNNYISFDAPLPSKPKTVEKSLYVPPQLRTAVKELASGLKPVSSQQPLQNGHKIAKENTPVTKTDDLTSFDFPTFGLCLSNEFTNEFHTHLSPVLEQLDNHSMVEMKMNVTWANFVYDFFDLSNLWAKLVPIFESHQSSKMDSKDDLVYIFEQVSLNGHVLEGLNSFLATNGDQNKDCKFTPVPSNFTQYHFDLLVTKLSKMPTNVRKKFATVHSFSVYPELMFALHSQWHKLSSQLTESQAPLDVFGRLCARIRTMVEDAKKIPLVSVTLIVACDTSASTPGIYVGFQGGAMDKVQHDVHLVFESIVKGLLPPYLTHRLQNVEDLEAIDQFKDVLHSEEI